MNTNFFTKIVTKTSSYIAKIIAVLMITSFTTLGSLAMVSFVSNMQRVDVSFGYVNMSRSKDDLILQNKLKQILIGNVSAEAVPAVITNILPTATTEFFQIFLVQAQSAISGFIGIILQPIKAILDQVLGMVDNLLNILEKFAEVLAGTRVAIGFLIYRDVEGSDGGGSSNFMSSSDFANSLIQDNAMANGSMRSDFPDKEKLVGLVSDAVSWLDFMTVQRSLQNGIIGDFLTNNSQFDVFTGDDVKGQVVDAIVGRQCESSKIFTIVPIFRDFMGKINTCQQEVYGPIESAFEARKQSILDATAEKLETYQLQPPADCKFGQYYEVTGDIKVAYEEGDKGNLGKNMASVADKIKLKQIKPDECESMKQAKLVQIDMAERKKDPANAFVASGGIGGVAGGLLSAITNSLNDIWKDFFDKIMERWVKIVNMISSIGSGSGLALWASLIDIALNIRQKIKQGLQTLNKEFINRPGQDVPNPKQETATQTP